MITTAENSSTLREKSPIATLSTTDLTMSALRSILKLVKEKPATYHVICVKINSYTSFTVVIGCLHT
jgi:hypothetical protein